MLLGALVAPGCGNAQGPVDAGLRGRVVTALGGPAAGVVVRLQSMDGTREGVTLSSADGSFVVLRLEAGSYRVMAGTAAEDVELRPGDLVEVTLSLAAAPVVGRANVPDLRKVVYTRETLEELPLRSREWEGAAGLDSLANESVAAARADAEGDEEAGGRETSSDGAASSGLSYAGLAATQNGALVDGLSSAQSFGAGPRGGSAGGVHAGPAFGEGAVGSFRVMPRTFSAQYGGAAGGVVAVVSRSGGEKLHGSLFVLARQSSWAAANPFSVVTRYRDGAIANSLVKPEDSREQFGVSVGLPVARVLPVRFHAAVFGSVEEQLKQDEIVSSPAVASFYALTPVQVGLLGNRGVSAAATNAALNYLDSLSGTTARSASRLLGFGRLDLEPGQRDRVTLAYVGDSFHAPAGAALGQASEAVVARGMGSLGDSYTAINAVTGRWLHGFSPRFNHELRVQVARDLEYETARGPLAQEPAIGPGGLAPQVAISPEGFAFGTPANLGRTAYPDERRVQMADAFEWALGRNVLVAGADWSRVDDRIASFANQEGSFSYDSGVTSGHAGGLVDWITDYTFGVNAYPNGACPNLNVQPHYFCFRSFTQSFGPAETEFVTHELAGFVEDSWRVRDGLTVSVGARYDYTLLPLPQAPNYALDEAFGAALGGATETFPEDRNNFAPRFSVAWSPGGKKKAAQLFTLHMGYGVFYGRLPGGTVRAALADTALASSATHIRITPTTTTACPQTPSVGFGYPCDYMAAPPEAVAQTTSAMVFAAGFRLPAVQRGELSVEREWGRHVSVRALYAGAIATQLAQSVDRNIAASTVQRRFVLQGGDGRAGSSDGESFAVPLYTARNETQYGPVSALVSSANATYHSGTLEGRWRSRGLQVRGSYSYSRAIDFAPQQGATPVVNGQFDPFDNRYDKGLSSLDFPQRFAGEMGYAMKLERGAEWLRRGVSGLRVSAIARAGSGAPYSYEVFGGTYLSGGRETMNGSGGATYLPTVGRNTLRLPARSSADLRLSRGFAMGGRWHGEGFLQGFNVLNSQSISRVETRAFLVGTPVVTNGVSGPTPLVFQNAAALAVEGLSTPAFGTPLSSTAGISREREIELGLRVEF